MAAGMGCVRVFNTGDDGGGKLLEATVPQQVWTNSSRPRDWTVGQKKARLAQMHPVLNIHFLEFVGLVSDWSPVLYVWVFESLKKLTLL